MSGAQQGWNLKDLDPKIREAAREAAERQGMTLGEFLNAALAKHQAAQAAAAATPAAPAPRPRRPSTTLSTDDDWRSVGDLAHAAEPQRLAQRIEAIERRTQLAVTGLDRAVSTIDRSLLGLSTRIDEAEAATADTADRIAEALQQFRIAGDTLGGRLHRAEQEIIESRQALDYAAADMADARERLEGQAAVAAEVARRAEAAVSYLSSEVEQRDAVLQSAREAAEEAARQAAEASHDAVQELHRLQEAMSARLAESEQSTRRAVAEAIEDVRAETANDTRGTREALLEEVVRLESEIARRMGAIDALKADQAELIQRIERAEHGARETTAGLRQAAGAAIADLRNAQLTLAARVKQIEDLTDGGAADLSDVRAQQHDIAERLGALEIKTDASPVDDALAAFERRLQRIETTQEAESDEVGGVVKTLDQSLQRLAARLAETESTANTAIRTLEETVSSLGARVEHAEASEETEALRALLEQRLDNMAHSMQQMVGDARAELADQLQAALDGVQTESLESALADVNRRLASAERRQAQTIEAISHEIRRMSETVDLRLRAVESRNDDAAGAAVREELSRMAAALEKRFDEIEQREAAAFDRMGLEVGRLSERLEERVGAVENRSAQAIEHVGEQVARMAERFSQRQEQVSRELSERMLDSEERSGARVAEAISSIMERLAEVEQQSVEAIAPVQKAVSSVASKLDRLESTYDVHDLDDLAPPAPHHAATPEPEDEFVDFSDFGEETSPMDAARPMRAAPLPPLNTQTPSDAQAPDYMSSQTRQLIDESGLIFDDDPRPEPEPALQDIEDEPLHETATPPSSSFDWAPPPLPEAEDLVMEDVVEPETPATTPIDDLFWTPEDRFNDAPEIEAHDEPLPEIELQPLDAPARPAEPTPPPPAKNDYLAAARRAAQVQAHGGAAARMTAAPASTETAPAPRLSLRGSSRIVLWGAASIVTLLAFGGARLLTQSQQPPAAAPEPVTHAAPAAPAPTEEAPVDDAAIAGALNDQAPTVAGPLQPRNPSLEQAAQTGNLTAQYELALQRLAGGQTQEAIGLLRAAADRGFAMAQYRLAKVFERGEGVPRDLTLARQWTERAAAAGNRRAMHDLGVYFARGEGAPVDEAAAFRWFRQAAELGVADSQYNLGVLYQQGRGVGASATEALFWFLVAARQGDSDANARATALEAQLTQAQTDQAHARAEAFRPRAASAMANGEFGPRPWARPGT